MARSQRKAPTKRATTRRRRKPATTKGERARIALSAGPLIVDAHCHTFNASDLSKVGFITEVLLDSDESLVLKFLQPFVVFLVKLIARAPGFQDELDHLNSLKESESLRSKTAYAQKHLGEREVIDQEYWANVENEVRRIAFSSNGQEQELFRAIVDEVDPGGMDAFSLQIGADSMERLAERIAFSRGPFARYIKWVGRLKHFRSDIIAELLETYGSEPNGVRLFTSALVDFEFWVKDKPNTSLPQQIELGALLSRAFPGRIHFLAPFDPWREIASDSDVESSLELVKRAVAEDGFIGVKVYPPMGFAASGNVDFDFSAVGVTDSPTFGAKLDRALDSLFEWALAEDVPIMAHCNLSQETKHGFARRAAPAFWAKVVSRYPGLRLNLGHFGGQDNLGLGGVNEAADWPENIIALMGTADGAGLYTDIGNFDMSDASWFTRLKATLEDNGVLRSRLMYGSDWMMLATSKDYEKFLDRFREGLAGLNTLTEAEIAAILGENARNFLGLNPGEKPRLRLEEYYATNNLPRPDWLQ